MFFVVEGLEEVVMGELVVLLEFVVMMLLVDIRWW